MWLKLKLLLWKSLRLRKTYWISTILEIITPILLFYFFVDMNPSKVYFSLVNQSIPDPMYEKQITADFIELHSAKNHFIYTPKNKKTEQIMLEVMSLLKIPPDRVTTTNSENEMITQFNTVFDSLKGFGIVFVGIENSVKFTYKIRSTSNIWNTNLLYPSLNESGPMNSGRKYFMTGFLALQLALDKSFILITNPEASNTTESYEFAIQSHPYKKYHQSDDTCFGFFLPTITYMSFIFMCMNTIKSIVDEKESGIKELMKIMGLKSWMIWTGWLLHNLLVYSISVVIIVWLCCINTNESGETFLSYTNPLLFGVFLMMYIISGIFFCFAISGFFSRSILASISGVVLWLASSQVLFDLSNDTASYKIKLISMLLPNIAMYKGYNLMGSLEWQELGLQISTIFVYEKNGRDFSVGVVFFMFIISCFLYGFIAWFMDCVKPGQYGIAKPINFLCIRSKSKSENIVKTPVSYRDSKLFEKANAEYEVGINVQDLYKSFGSVHAVNGVNLQIYKGQITALLGHNGAGKTTTMSIITGMFSPTSGSVAVNGRDIFNNLDEFRGNIGLCTQHNLLFSYMSVLDHLLFFGMLKGLSYADANSEGISLLTMLGIFKKKDQLVSSLSGGMKRKLSLAIALIGNPEILILDEPTSGMDAESRREMWDFLLSLRGNRTVLITTHFMEEADVLGDRIAIMDHGKVICYGTPLFLKKAYGTGYHLTIIKNESGDVTKMNNSILEIIPDAELQSSLSAQVVYNLPNETTDRFPDLFKMLEERKIEFGITGMGVSCITMEEVFLSSAGSKDHVDKPKGVTNGHVNESNEASIQKMTGLKLMKNQFKILLTKSAVYSLRSWFLLTILALLSILIIMLTMLSMRINVNDIETSTKEIGLNLALSAYQDSNVYYRIGDNSSDSLEPYFAAISKMNQATVNIIPSNHNLTNDLLELCTSDTDKYRSRVMIAGDFNNTKTTVMFNTIAYHTPGIAVNLYTNALLQKISGNSEMSISVTNDPIPLIDYNECKVVPFNAIQSMVDILTASMALFISCYIAMPLKERVSGFKHIQMMTKISPVMYWSACFAWDYICFLVFIVITMVVMYFIDEYHIITGPEELPVLSIILLAYGWSSIFYAYSFSFFKKSLTSSISLFITINFIMGYTINALLYYANIFWAENIWFVRVRFLLFLVPVFSSTSCMSGFSKISYEKHVCKLCPAGACDSKKYFEFASDENPDGILGKLLFLLFSGLMYFVFVLLMDYKVFARVHQSILNTMHGSGVDYNGDDEDPDVGGERDKVRDAKVRPYNDAASPLLVVDNLIKKYSSAFTAVRGVSFTVLPGECFGLLGVNGAGKTTTFQILTGDIFPSKGDVAIQTDRVYKLSSTAKQYTSRIGYCPQYDALNDQLTAIETLMLMAILKGIPPNNAKKTVDKWIKDLGLEEYKNKICGTYSGGNKRKLNTAIALIGDPPVVLLDEPTSGVDPAARRNLWAILTSSRRGGQVVVLTSHSMDECEALCNRLTIMVDGQLKCIGNIQYLKNRYGQGFTVMIKIIASDQNDLIALKVEVERLFAPDIQLKDQHKGLLHYHITNPSVLLSDIFGHMKEIKENYTIVEDYTVSDTTLEQVFIAFAKRQAIITNTNA